MNTNGIFSSKTCLWETPQWLFDELNEEFRFTLDVCASDENHKCNVYFTDQDNGLAQDWKGVCWMNPPYGKEIAKWVKKAYEVARGGVATTVCLLPARTDTKWWQAYVMKAKDIRYVSGRLKFVNSKNSAPFPSAIVVFRKQSTYESKE